ncbi:hypothetical protein BDL97_12G076400 [Sphagnum fallax]|nr:hypothetical protein BDL97_12G076400 [Sphagnum fallax]KAH8946118.1 hypothetical protein BDL97_12G076400 [Sphagnum fallax]
MMNCKVGSSASGMAVAAKAARACDVCGVHRARWYCAADEAYICHPCDAKVHEANSLASRHNRVLLSPHNPPKHKQQQQQHRHRHEHQAAGDSQGMMMNSAQKISRRSNPGMRISSPNLNLFATTGKIPAERASFTKTSGRKQELYAKVKVEPAGGGDEYMGGKGSNWQAGVHEVPAFVSIFQDPLPEFSTSKVVDDTQNHHVHHDDELSKEEEQEEVVPDLFPRHFYFDATLGPLKEDSPGGCTFLGEEIPGMDGYENSYKYMEPDPSSLDSKAHHAPYAEGSLSCAFRPPETDNFMGGAGAGGCRQKKKQEAVEDLVGATYPLEEGLTATEAAAAARACHVPSLKLNYKEVLSACSDQSLWTAHDKHPQTVPDDPIADAVGNMDLGFVPDLNFGPQEMAVTRDDCYSGRGRREASLLRYKEKRRARLFSKKIRYEVRKLNAEQRPRMKGRFVKRTQWSTPEDGFGSY